MLLGLLDLLFSDPLLFLRVLPVFLGVLGLALLLAITVHEFSHALAAYALGDLTAKRLGRLSLNPVRHLDPMGTALLLLVGFGWGKPVPVNPLALRTGRLGMAMVAAAGPLSNLATALLVAVILRTGIPLWPFPLGLDPALRGGAAGLLSDILGFSILFNIVLAVFNLLPLFPLDGSKVALGLLPSNMARSFARLERYGPMLLLAVIALDAITNVGIFNRIVGPVVNYVGQLLVGEAFF